MHLCFWVPTYVRAFVRWLGRGPYVRCAPLAHVRGLGRLGGAAQGTGPKKAARPLHACVPCVAVTARVRTTCDSRPSRAMSLRTSGPGRRCARTHVVFERTYVCQPPPDLRPRSFRLERACPLHVAVCCQAGGHRRSAKCVPAFLTHLRTLPLVTRVRHGGRSLVHSSHVHSVRVPQR